MKKLFFTLFVFLSCSSIYSQVAQTWVNRYNGPNNKDDYGRYMKVDGSGNVYVTGFSVNNGGGADIVTIKYNSAGVQEWVQQFNGPGNYDDYAKGIAVDRSGNVYVTGETRTGSYIYDFATIKYNSSGVQQWLQIYNGPSNLNDSPIDIAADDSGNVFVTGSSISSTSYSNYATIKYNTSGVLQWVQIYNGPDNKSDEPTAVGLDDFGNVYVTGSSQNNSFNSDFATIKYSSSGTEQWVQRYNGLGNGSDRANSLAIDLSGNVYITGGSRHGNDTVCVYATIKYNSSGIQQWIKTYNYSDYSFDEPHVIAVDNSGNVIVTGFSSLYSIHSYSYSTVKYNSSGTQQWVQRYIIGNPYNNPNSMAIDRSGNVYMTCNSVPGFTEYDYVTLKYNSTGIQQWIQSYNGPGNSGDYPREIAVDTIGNVYVTGESNSGNFVNPNYDIATIKYSQTSGIRILAGSIPNDFRLFQNYPNPFNPSTKIKFEITINSDVKLVVCDVLGKEVEVLSNEYLKAGVYEAEWNAANYSNGIYYYTLSTSGFADTKKMILLK